MPDFLVLKTLCKFPFHGTLKTFCPHTRSAYNGPLIASKDVLKSSEVYIFSCNFCGIKNLASSPRSC